MSDSYTDELALSLDTAEGSSTSSSIDGVSDGDLSSEDSTVLPFDSEHPTMYAPQGMANYPPHIIEAWTLLHNAAETGGELLPPCVLNRLTKEVLDELTDRQESIMLIAAARGVTHIVEYLLKSGADPYKTGCSMTPISTAMMNCHIECVNLLLDHLDINETDASGFTPLTIALHIKRGSTSLHSNRFHQYDLGKMLVNSEACLNILLKRGADVNKALSTGDTPLHIAAEQNHEVAIGKLLHHGADPRVANGEGVTPLDRAVERGSIHSLKLLLRKYVENDWPYPSDKAMACAISTEQLECIKCLVEAGFDAHYGVRLPPTELARYQEKPASVPTLVHAADAPAALVDYLLMEGAVPLHKGQPFGYPLPDYPLYNAFMRNTRTLMQFLEKCATIPDVVVGENSYLPLHFCHGWVWKKPPLSFEVLLQAGFKLNIKLMPYDRVCNTELEEVLKIWWMYTNEIPRCQRFRDVLGAVVETPRSLANLCRVVIRQRIGFPRLALASESTELLPVPQIMRTFLRYGHLKLTDMLSEERDCAAAATSN